MNVMKLVLGARRRATVLALAGTAGLLSVSPIVGPSAAAAEICSALSAPVIQVAKESSGSSLLTVWASEADAASIYGFTTDLGVPFTASMVDATELTPVHRLYNPATYDFWWALEDSSTYASAVKDGYRDHGVGFYASATPISGCTGPLLTFTRGTKHRIASDASTPRLLAEGWAKSDIAFHAPLGATDPEVDPEPDSDGTFSFAVIPDTQNEVGNTDPRMAKRVSWLAATKAKHDVRWVLQSGDLQSWDTADHYQFANMSSRLEPLAAAGLPLIAVPGNHDTAAVCPGGAACPGANTKVTLRDTSTWDSFYPPSRFGLEGVYQQGSSANGYRTFMANGHRWLVLSIELWPRTEVIAWAREVVAAHPLDNVIVLTHAFLEGNGSVGTTNGGYGANSPTILWSALDDFPNVVMFFSGHVGDAATRTLTAADGHKVVAYLQTFHHPSSNPTRLVTVDTANGTLTSEIRLSYDRSLPEGERDVDQVLTQYSSTISGMRWVK